VVDEGTEFGARVGRHLREEIVVWMTTVTPAGGPVPMPVWFLWDGGEAVRVYSRRSPRVRNIQANPHVSLNFAGDGGGGDIVVLSGTATADPAMPAANEDADYVTKYRDHIARIGLTPETFALRYEVPVRIQLTQVRGH
jgi:PPOX class probable F420-dependent enzyme